ncbi:BRE1 E3 ubiquitin ligase-domain-containing protein [Corynascus novoguineensis]|uniref:E3 ubiquitin protein ligase n=1 Tax=Corynascus novoguineensis TaxID=1126955 RepID=A0AAN7CXR0_9PEZI|nr:BRE1 E3 ubiquitin ligase-domain-containing protein [Corynascus novoguineensis]
MEDRKRPASGAVDDGAPPSKRQAVNGGSKSKDDSGDMKEEAWIEEYQKGAIYRQMLEYKREKINLESRVQELEKNSTDHDDHIRIVDAWVLQLLQEIELLVEGAVSSTSSADLAPGSALAFKDSKDFQRHLSDKGKALRSKSDAILKRLAGARGEVKPEVAQLESQIKSLLAQQKELIVKVDRLETQNASLSEQYDKATLKVIKAERKLDRVKSAQVQKLEQQALAGATAHAASKDENGAGSNPVNGDSEALKLQYQEAMAVVAKQKQQLEAALSENKALAEENSTYKIKKEAVTDEEYARTELFKQFKGQNEDLIKRINHLEATNKQLREEAEKLRGERTEWKTKLENEAQVTTLELEDQLQQKDQDLTRIRSARDELMAEVAMRKASQDQEKTALTQIKELSEAQADRIAELESELERLRPSEHAAMTDPRPDLEALPVEELRQRYVKLEKDFEAINKELPLLEKSYRKSMALAHKKVIDFHHLEERVATLTAEKSKADQKYFAARKDMDIRTAEIRTLRAQNGKSSEIISQLKDVETQNRALIGSLEKQIAALKQDISTAMTERKRLELVSTEATRRADSCKSQISNLADLVKAKDAAVAAMKEQLLKAETELEKAKVDVKEISKDCQRWKAKCQSNSSEEEEALRNLVICSVCRSNFKNTILKGCGHVFCNSCVDDRLANRMRKCPSCNKAFDRSDAMAAHL